MHDKRATHSKIKLFCFPRGKYHFVWPEKTLEAQLKTVVSWFFLGLNQFSPLIVQPEGTAGKKSLKDWKVGFTVSLCPVSALVSRSLWKAAPVPRLWAALIFNMCYMRFQVSGLLLQLTAHLTDIWIPPLRQGKSWPDPKSAFSLKEQENSKCYCKPERNWILRDSKRKEKMLLIQ